MKNKISGAVLFTCTMLLASCGPQGRTDRMESPGDERSQGSINDVDVERAEVESDLLELRTKLDGRIADVDARMETPAIEDERRAELIRYREELQDRRNRLERARRDIDGSRSETWNDVRTATNNTADDVRVWFDEQEDRLDAIFRDDKNNMDNDGEGGILKNNDIIDKDGVDDPGGVDQNGDIIDNDGVDDEGGVLENDDIIDNDGVDDEGGVLQNNDVIDNDGVDD
ncbi:MAG: hypothetical protein M3R08_00910 [Bacteroidota bacterium]|nr:hypothetical protein [Bacteroidota bacterium]